MSLGGERLTVWLGKNYKHHWTKANGFVVCAESSDERKRVAIDGMSVSIMFMLFLDGLPQKQRKSNTSPYVCVDKSGAERSNCR